MFNLQEILQATRGTLIKGSEFSPSIIQGVSIDSRTIRPGDLFIAIKGDRFDGHEFVGQAIESKAAAVIVSKRNISIPKRNVAPIIFVKDTIQALGKIAHFHRHRFSIPIIALTGSTGKTTTKEMIATVLESRYNVLKNIATENNHIGVPMTLLKLNHQHEIAVLEFGTNRFGDIRWLSQITNPTTAVFTNIGESHLEFLKTPAGVFKEKSRMLNYLHSSPQVIINIDDVYLKKILSRKINGKILTYGIGHPSDFQAGEINLNRDSKLFFKVNKRQGFQLNSLAVHNIYNALAAIACGRLFKIGYSDIRERIAQCSFPKGRQVVHKTKRFWIIDDTYNANPVSVRSALKTLCDLKSPGRKIFVCADMLELGRRCESLHSSIGELIGKSSLNAIFTLGEFSRLISQTAKKQNKTLTAFHEKTIESVHHRLKEYCRTGDVILVKGSRAMRMERTVEFLTKESAGVSN